MPLSVLYPSPVHMPSSVSKHCPLTSFHPFALILFFLLDYLNLSLVGELLGILQNLI